MTEQRKSPADHWNQEQWRQFWQEHYQDNADPWAEADPWLVREVGEMMPGRVVDLGCGEGCNALWLARKGWRVTAVDFAPAGLASLRRQAANEDLSIETVEAAVTTFDSEQPFDLVLLAYMHLPEAERQQMLANACRLVARGGVLLYIGLTEMAGKVPDGVAPLFVDAETVVAGLQGVEVQQANVALRKSPVPGAAADETCHGVIVRALKKP